MIERSVKLHISEIVIALMILASFVFIPGCGPTDSPSAQAKIQSVVPTATLTPVPTFTETATPTALASATSSTTATATLPPPNIAPTAIPTDPPTATLTRRPATSTPAPPTATPQPTATPTSSVAFKVIQQAMLSKKENGCEGGGHVYYIMVVDKSGAPIDNVIIRRLYAGNIQIPPTGAKGPGKTEDVAPRFAGDRLYVYRDNNNVTYDYQAGQTELTRNLSEEPREIGPEEHVAGGFCDNISDCQIRINEGTLCAGHYSYRITFQKQ